MIYQTYHHNRNWGCRIVEITYAGYRSVVLENEKIRVTVLADKGTDVLEFLYKPHDVDFLWRTRTGLRPRHFVPTSHRAAGSHADYYEGGWHEMFPNCGPSSIHQDAELGQHGEVSLLPWDYSLVTDEPDLVEVRFSVRTARTPFHLTKTLALRRNEPVLRIREKVVNEGGQPVDYTWGHHPVLGWPFLDEQCRIVLPDCTIRTFEEFTPDGARLKPGQSSRWPIAEGIAGAPVDLSRMPGPDAATQDMAFLDDLEDGWYAVVNSARRVGFGMWYPADLFKVVWYWQVCRGGRNYPWWAATYNLALEPCASYPSLARAVERGEALQLGSGESREIELLAVAFEARGDVTGIDPTGNVT
jgi:hypothetical protein